MSEEAENVTPSKSNESPESTDRPRRSRKRGRRNRSRSSDQQQQVESPAEATQAKPEPSRQAAPPQRERSPRRSGGQRASSGFADGQDRFVCEQGLRMFQSEWPVNHRSGVAVAPMREVARRAGEILLCDGLHAGECVWPDGELAGSSATLPETRVPSEASPQASTAQVEPEASAGADV